MASFNPPGKDCTLCPRLVTYRQENKAAFPDKFNGAVPSFGGLDAQLLIVGLAPGLKGANFTSRPFTGDYAGAVLYAALLKGGFAKGSYDGHANDGVELINTRITNAVRCVPPQNKPIGEEMKNCLPFLKDEVFAMPNLKAILCLGRISHDSTLKALGFKMKDYAFGHGAEHDLGNELMLIDSYHCSRYNINTNRLTTEMFDKIIDQVREKL